MRRSPWDVERSWDETTATGRTGGGARGIVEPSWRRATTALCTALARRRQRRFSEIERSGEVRDSALRASDRREDAVEGGLRLELGVVVDVPAVEDRHQ